MSNTTTKPGNPGSNSRRRRFPYVAVACEKCQRRKLKCSGGQPCDRCRQNSAPCLYPRTTRFRRPSIETGSPQDTPVAGNQSQNDKPQSRAIAPSDAPRTASFSGSPAVPRPGSFDYYLRLAQNRFGASPDQTFRSNIYFRHTEVGIQQLQQAITHRSEKARGSALAVCSLDSWARILQTYDEEVGQQYPFLDIVNLQQRIGMTLQRSSFQDSQTRSTKDLNDSRVEDIALLVLALLSVFADSASVDIANPLVEEIFGTAIVRSHMNTINTDDLTLLILTSIFFFLSDREVQAWRGIGTVMRLLQEGDHETPPADQAAIPEKFYWSVYTLDRRWSFGTGLPFSVPDEDIKQPPLSMTDGSLSSSYLRQMVSYCGIASAVRKSILSNTASNTSVPESTRDLLNFRVVQWQQNLPRSLQFLGPTDKFDPAKEKRGDYKLRLVLYLRANQMRTIILRKSATPSGPNTFAFSSIRSMMEIAQDTIRVLVGLARETDIYHAQHRTFNHFLETALSSLLLVLCSIEPTQSSSCLGDIIAAIELVHRLSSESQISRRLGEKLQGMREVVDGLKLGENDLVPPLEGAENVMAIPSTIPEAQNDVSSSWGSVQNLGGPLQSTSSNPAAEGAGLGTYLGPSTSYDSTSAPSFTSPHEISSTSEISSEGLLDSSQRYMQPDLVPQLDFPFEVDMPKFQEVNDILAQYDFFSF